MVVLDCPEFFYLFWGAIKAGIVPVPLNTLLRAKDYRYMIEDSGCRLVVYSPELAAEVEPALKQLASSRRCGRCVPATQMAAAPRARAAPPARPTTASGSTRRARPASPRAPSTPIATWRW